MVHAFHRAFPFANRTTDRMRLLWRVNATELLSMPTTCYLISVYNDQSGLDRSIRSILEEQTLADVLIVDDGSPTPLTIPTELSEVGQRRITILRLAENVGITKALNAGLERLLAEDYAYIARLDASDTVAPDRLARQIAFLESHPEVGLVASDVAFQDEFGRVLYTHRVPTRHEDIVREMRFNNCLLHPAVTIRASVWKAVGQYDPDVHVAEDYDLFVRICRDSRVASIASTLTTASFNPLGISLGRRRRQQLARLSVQAKYFQFREPSAYLGVARTLVSFAIPTRVAVAWKRGY